MALQLRRGTDAERQLVTFAIGELIYTSDTKKLFVGDGTTLGGKFVGGIAEAGVRPITVFENNEFITVFEPEYTSSGHLVMNNFDVTGVRNLSVSSVSSSLVPNNSGISLGETNSRWNQVFVNNISVAGTINGNITGVLTGQTIGTHIGNVDGNMLGGNVIAKSGRVMVDGDTDSFDGVLYGPVYGSVYGDDSSVIVDSFRKIVSLPPLTEEPTGAIAGMFAVADGVTWDPVTAGGSTPYPVFYNGTVWLKMTA
jgi:hypothetical protein